MSAWRNRVGDLTLFEALTGGAFDRLNWQHSGGFGIDRYIIYWGFQSPLASFLLENIASEGRNIFTPFVACVDTHLYWKIVLSSVFMNFSCTHFN